MIIADYYQINRRKWNLNTLETEFYRPAAVVTAASTEEK
jgi:hypothetical protein